MAAKFKEGSKYRGPLVNGSKKVVGIFEYTGKGWFKTLGLSTPLEYYALGEPLKILTDDKQADCYWDLKAYQITLENK